LGIFSHTTFKGIEDDAVGNAGSDTMLISNSARCKITKAQAHKSNSVRIYFRSRQGEVDHRRNRLFPVGSEGQLLLVDKSALSGIFEYQVDVATAQGSRPTIGIELLGCPIKAYVENQCSMGRARVINMEEVAGQSCPFVRNLDDIMW